MIHRRAGASRLPSVCRHFPRVVVTDPRGASITLSHFCPTAADLLFAGTPLAIVEAPPSLALDGEVEGLDATAVLPPLLSQGVLTDWEGYSAWEEAAVALFNDAEAEPEQAVGSLERATDLACGWRPGREPLAAAMRRAFAASTIRGSTRISTIRGPTRISTIRGSTRITTIRGFHTDLQRSGDIPDRGNRDQWNGLGRVANAFLAAHAFASWAAYDRDGLRAIAAAVRRALTLLTKNASAREPLTREGLIEAIRDTDLALRHRS